LYYNSRKIKVMSLNIIIITIINCDIGLSNFSPSRSIV
jgi:hypothetical protein